YFLILNSFPTRRSSDLYFEENYGKGNNTLTPTDSSTAQGLINDGYVAVYFDFDKSQPKNTDAINFILTYLKSNPNAKVDVQGYRSEEHTSELQSRENLV